MRRCYDLSATFTERDGGTLVVMRDTYRSKEALDEAIASGSTSGGYDETFAQLEDVLVTLERG